MSVNTSPAVLAARLKVKREHQARLAAKLAALGTSPSKVAELLMGSVDGPVLMRSLDSAKKGAKRAASRGDVHPEEMFKPDNGFSPMIAFAVLVVGIAFIWMRYIR